MKAIARTEVPEVLGLHLPEQAWQCGETRDCEVAGSSLERLGRSARKYSGHTSE